MGTNYIEHIKPLYDFMDANSGYETLSEILTASNLDTAWRESKSGSGNKNVH